MPPKQLPEDPIIRSLVQAARRSQVTRRGVLAGGVGAGLAAFLAACAGQIGGGQPGGTATTATGPTPAEDLSASDPTMTWANWSYYLDEDKKGNHPTLEAFTKSTGIEVTYDVAVEDNNSYYAAVIDQLRLGQDIGADTVCLTDWMIGILLSQGFGQQFDKSIMPNVNANLAPSYVNADFDPNRNYSVPWQSGFAGIGWNKERLPKGLATLDDLWDPELRGRVGVLSEMRDTIGLIMLSQGVDISSQSWGETEFANALDVFEEQVSNGQIRNIKGNSYAEDLQNEDTLAAIVWSGDITAINFTLGEDKFGFAIPDSGGTLWSDNFIIPIGSHKKTNAEKLIDYYYDPEVAAEVAAWVNYITPVVGAQEAMEKIDPSLVDDQLIFPSEETLSMVKMFRTLSVAEQQDYQSRFDNVGLGA